MRLFGVLNLTKKVLIEICSIPRVESKVSDSHCCCFSFLLLELWRNTKGNFVCCAGVEIPKYVDNVTPEYKPKFDALVSYSFYKLQSFTMFFFEKGVFIFYLVVYFVPCFFLYIVGGTERSRTEVAQGVWTAGEGNYWCPGDKRKYPQLQFILHKVQSVV